ncbi:MAG: SRPBCC family protein [Oligoflexales bacterium]
MKKVQTEIEISAPPEDVWKVLSNIDDWQNWSPVINKSQGTAALGSKVVITMCSKEEGKDGPKYSPVITKFDEPKSLHWRATMMAGIIFTNDKHIDLEKTDSGTRVIHKELFSGIMAAMMGSHMEDGVPPILNKMNEALKQKVEKERKVSA